MLKNNNGFYKKRVIASFFIFVLCFSFLTGVKKVEAQVVHDPINLVESVVQFFKEGIGKKITDQLKKAGSNFYQKTLTYLVNTIAHDAANYIASSEKGQKPLFTTDYLTELGKKAGDAAISEFVTTIYDEWQVDLCHPSLDIQNRIGLGLVDQRQPTLPTSCGWQEMKSSWTSEYDKWKSIVEDKTYLDKVSQMFSPTGNDVAIALELFGRTEEVYKASKEKEEEQIRLNSGWLDVRDIGGQADTYPGAAKDQLTRATNLQDQSFGKFTGEALVDATNLFLNQLGIAGFNRLITELGKIKNTPDSNPDDPTDDSDDYNADPRSYSGGNYLTQSLKKIIQPRFDVRADYNILSDLVVCVDANNPLPNNCVISDRFSQAVQNKNTVIEAINNGYLSADMVFSKEADYRAGLNERSLIILRKFRIIPLGWEEALSRAEKKGQETKNNYTLMDMISCFSPHDEFETFSQGFIRSGFTDYSWCEGLVDPSWVLKAPLNYCKKEGFGGYIMVKQAIDVPSSASNIDINIDPIVISRADNYCADEQSCIKENSDGSCEYYGYCTEEKRTWNFNQDSCDPIYNTCDSFTSTSNGKKLALLKNTIDYGSCSSDNVGCLQYSLGGSYNTSSSKISWNNYPLVYFNNKVESCSSSNESCNEYLRTIAGGGHNFLINGDFEKPLSEGDWGNLTTSSVSYSGNLSILLNNTLQKNVVVAPSNYTIAGESYTLSFYSFCSGNGTSTVSLGSKTQDISKGESFVYQAITNVFPSNYNNNTVAFGINASGNTCLIDNIKLEKGNIGTYYSNYRGNNLVYQKTIPEYLKTTCYQNPYSSSPDYRLKSDAPSACYNYARLCNNNEIGCNLFTSIFNIKTAAKVLDKDYCPEQCVGYDIYVQKKTLFEDKAVAKFIPGSARTCGAVDAGCTEFTNLDEVAAGGEGKEYYTYLRHCIKPAQGTCESFYSWQGNDESGYQLKSFSLEKDNTGSRPKLTKGVFLPANNATGVYNQHFVSGNIGGPLAVNIAIPLCSEAIYNLSPSDPLYNSDCREFYNQDGEKFYVLYSNTITCSDNCKTYRMTDKNVNTEVNNSVSCVGETRHWNSDENVCYDCLAGGKWDNTQNACVYQAIPGEGQTCQASNNGCREYNGNAGNSVRNIASYNFDLGLNNWEGSVTSSLESLSQNGKSMKLTGAGEVNIGYSVKKGSSYVIKFLARSTQNKNLSISFSNGVGSPALFGVSGLENQEQDYSINLPSSNDWKLYQVNLENLNHDISEEEILEFAFTDGGEIYISNINLLEINSRYYLIKDSWNTPEACYYDTIGVYQGVNYNLGCQSYTDRNSQNHNLRQFSSLCDSSAVGCEMVIDTHNSSEINSEIYNDHNNNSSCDADEVDCLNIPADNFVAMVYDSNKSCNSENKGCSRLGKSIANNPYMVAQNLYSDVYVKNDPDKYNNILCQQDELGCDAWTSSYSGVAYFKDPGDNICLWRKGVDSSSNYAWYKKAVKKCKAGNTFTNNICNTNNDCSDGQVCELDIADYLCPVESLKTIGLGGNSPIYQPSAEFGANWAGACPIKQAGCTEYLDPSSSFSQNLVNNPNFADKDGDGQGFDDWTSGSVCAISNGSFHCVIPNNYTFIQYIQDKPLAIEPNKLYILKTNGPQEAILECDSPVYELQSDNKFSTGVNSLNATSTNPKRVFYSGDNNNSCTIKYRKNIDLVITVPSLESSGLLQGYFNINLNNSKLAFLNKLFKIDSVEAQGEDYSIEVKEVVMDYQLKQALDFSGCNGQADFNSGCVVFNERAVSANGQISSLNFNSSNYSNYSTCSGNNCDANSLIKVTADRTCGKWLSCYSWTTNPYTNEKICLEMGECSAFNYDGSCFNFIKPEGGTREYTPGRDNNATGYSVLGMKYLANMNQVGEDYQINGDQAFDFEIEGDVIGKWKKGPTFNSDLASSDCWINKPNSGNMGNKVSYPAHGLGFLKIGGSHCGEDDFVISNDHIDAPTNSDYYLNFIINTEELSFSEKVEIKVVGVNGDNTLDWNVPTSTINQASGWQDISIKFSTKVDWTNGVKIALKSSNGGSFYVDNIRLEPVLEVKENEKYLQAICRLFPAQDSLTCETQNKNFVTNGWYGYCLQKDPKNSDVCLMWYPIDAVMGTKGSGQAQSAFPGYPDTGAKPYYCAEMSGNFDLVEYRDVYYLETSGTINHFQAVSTPKVYSSSVWCDSKSNYYKVYLSTYDPHRNKCNEASPFTDTFTNFNSNAVITWFFCVPDSNNKTVLVKEEDSIVVDYNPDAGKIGDNNVCCVINEDDCNPSDPSSTTCDRFACTTDINQYPDLSAGQGAVEYLQKIKSNQKIINKWDAYDCSSPNNCIDTYAGWYRYDGDLDSEPEEDKKLKLLAYDYDDIECAAVGGNYLDHNNTSDVDGKGCLMEIEDYVPKCTKIVQGETPWVKRVTNSNLSMLDYKNNDPDYEGDNVFQYYEKGLPGAPFGAIKLVGDELIENTAYAGSPLSNNSDDKYKQYGFPYSCNSFGRTANIAGGPKNTCSILYLDEDKNRIMVLGYNEEDPSDLTVQGFYDLSGVNYGATSIGNNNWEWPNIIDYLKHIWVKIKTVADFSISNFISMNWNFTGIGVNNNPASAPSVDSGINPRSTATSFYARYPKIENIFLTDSNGNTYNKLENTDTYRITNPGYYTLSFNTDIDAEQVPISSLLIRIKESNSNWASSTGIISQSIIDSLSDEGNPHRITKYLSSGDYQILVKVVDNWGFYKCEGLGGFANMSGVDNCSYCCVGDSANNIEPLQSEFCRICFEGF